MAYNKNRGSSTSLKAQLVKTVVLIFIGAFLLFFSIVLLFFILGSNQINFLAYFITQLPKESSVFLSVLLLLTGFYIVALSTQMLGRMFESSGKTDVSHKMPSISKDEPKIVVLGGGTGLSALLRGLKNYTNSLTAIVTAADDGGSSGRIRKEWGLVPPGDIRSCLLALADTEPLMNALFDYRFDAGEGLEGHNFGNLFIVAMSEVTGDFESAVQEFSRVLNVRGQVMTSTLNNVSLKAVFEDGSEIIGESKIGQMGRKIRKVSLVPNDCTPNSSALSAIAQADFIVLGPGSLYTSVLPNLLVPGIVEAIKKSKAPVLYVVNVMSEPGETTGYTASDHLNAILEHVEEPGLVDYVLLNNAEFSFDTKKRYEEEGAFPVTIDLEKLELLGVKVVSTDLRSSNNYARHDPEKLAKAVMSVILDKS